MSKQVKIYTVTDCYHCNRIRQILTNHGIEFKEEQWDRKDREIDNKFYQLTGEYKTRFPVTFIDDKMVIGFDLVEIDKELSLTPAEAEPYEEAELEDVE